MVKYVYKPEEELMSEKKVYQNLPDGHYNFEVINIVPGIEDKDDRVEFYLEGGGRSGRWSAFFSGLNSKLWILVNFLKSIDRMDLYSKNGETNLTKVMGHKGSLVLKTKYSETHKKEFQNADFVAHNGFHEKAPHHVQQATSAKESTSKWEKDFAGEDDEIPF